ncbi:MAG: tRNA (N(6)-L-threonylcarbamoyladenosine(37)-C(2))-methylthiotransferase MtaB, partial [Bacteroidetes bacterium]
LVEKIDEDGFASGYGEHYVYVKFKSADSAKTNEFSTVEIIDIEKGEDPDLIGKVII